MASKTFELRGVSLRRQATHHQRYRGRVYASQIFFAKDRYSLYVLRYFFNGPSLCSGNRSNAARMFTARQAATKICAANCANGSFAQFAAKESSQKSKKPAISSTKWSNFAKPKQTRAKARAATLSPRKLVPVQTRASCAGAKSAVVPDKGKEPE